MHHPLWRGFLLAIALVAALTLGAPADLLPPGDRATFAQAAMIIPGAFLAALPGRSIRRKEARPRLDWRRCIAGFIGGFGATAGLLLAGGGWSLQWLLALGTGGIGSAAFTATALIFALICAWARRRELV